MAQASPPVRAVFKRVGHVLRTPQRMKTLPVAQASLPVELFSEKDDKHCVGWKASLKMPLTDGYTTRSVTLAVRLLSETRETCRIAIMRIPEKFQRSFQRLATMSDRDFSRLRDALADTPPTFNVETFAERVAVKGSGLSPVEISELVAAISPLMSSVTDQDDIGSFAVMVSSSIQANEKLDVGEEAGRKLESRLCQLFAIEDTLGTVARARAIYFFSGNDFCDVKVVTDIRPVFRSDPTVDPTAAVLVHDLQIGYHTDRDLDHQDFTVTLDEAELDQLQAAIERARAKAKTLTRMVERAGMRCLKPDLDHDAGA